jgi:hypothetical protein
MQRLFMYFDPSGSGTVEEGNFAKLASRMYVCVKAIAMTSAFDMGKSKILRSLAEKEEVEVIDGPRSDPSTKMERLHVKCLSDAKEGWVTVKGNQGTAFLEPLDSHIKDLDSAFKTKRADQTKAMIQLKTVERLTLQAEGLLPQLKDREKALLSQFLNESDAQELALQAAMQSKAAKKQVIAASEAASEIVSACTSGLLRASALEDINDRIEEVKTKAQRISELGASAVERAKELEKVRVDKCKAVLDAFTDHSKKSGDEVSKIIEGLVEGGSVPRTALTSYAAEQGVELEEDQAEYLVKYLDLKETGKISPKSLQIFTAPLYRCIQKIAITSEQEIGKGDILLQLDVGMLVLALGDTVDEEKGIQRLRVHLWKDPNVAGWTSVKGSQGSTFLEAVSLDMKRDLCKTELEI